MTICFFVSDLHGNTDHYQKLFHAIKDERPGSVFLGGDILPSIIHAFSSLKSKHVNFINDYLVKQLNELRRELGDDFPRLFLILGNDDGRFAEVDILNAATTRIWEYVHDRKVSFGNYLVFGYSYIPPSPFLLKDWEKYDVSRYVDPGCISPEEGVLTVPDPDNSRKYATIQKDLDRLTGNENLEKAIFLFHSPPYKTKLDQAALEGKMIDHVPLDTNIGSIAIKRFIENRQPLLTLHGHVHEASSLSGSWQDKIGNTSMFTAAYEGPELALIRFDPENLSEASRELL